MDPGSADVVSARNLVGNAAVTAALGGGPRGAVPGPDTWTARLMLAGQDLVGNQAVVSGATATPAAAGQKKPAEARPTKPKATPPPVPKPEAPEKKGTGERQDKSEKKPEPTGPRSPGADPKFQALTKDVDTKKRKVGAGHPPPATEAGAAQAAAEPPADDREARGKAAHAEDMDAAQPKEFDRQAFIEAVEKAIRDRAPKNLDEADKFGESGKAEEVKAEVQGKVGEGKDASAKEIADTTAEVPEPAPDAKDVVPLAPDRVPAKPGAPNPGQATPDPLPASVTDLSEGPANVEDQMAQAQVTEKQLSFKNSREPAFDKAVQDKKAMDAHATTAPGRLRGAEAKRLGEVRATAAAQGASAMGAMQASRVSAGRQVSTGKQGAKGRDEDKRATVTALLQKVFDQTTCDVEKILSDLDKAVDRQFTRGEKAARDRFTGEHERGMKEYKDQRYSGPLGALRWGKDKLFGLPDEVNRIYERARDHYLSAMGQVIADIAGTVERELRRAKDRIATGRTELRAAVDKLPADLKAIGREAAGEFESRFDELTDTVNDKGTELVDTLATKYTDAVKAVDEEIAAEKEKNRGLVAKAADAIGGAIKAIVELGRMLMGVLRKAASAIGLILKDPIGFLGNLITGVGGGLKLFMRNAGRHLQQGVLAWLLGTAGTAGIQLPATFDAMGILMVIASLLGLTWAAIRARLARRVPDQAIAAAETAVPLVVETRKRGVSGMWSELKAHVGDLKKQLIGDLVSYLLPTIVIAGVTWIVSLFNPASAFIRACKMIIDIIRFIVTQGRQIIEFVNTVLDAVIAIARGGTGGVPALVERALARSIPVLIGALAAILGIGGIAGKVKQIFQKLARPVTRAVDKVIDKIVALVKKLWAKRKPRTKKRPDERGKEDNGRLLDAALRDARALVRARKPVDEIKPRLPLIRRKHKLTKLVVVVERVQGAQQIIHFVAAVNPEKKSPPEGAPLTREQVREDYGILIRNQERFQRYADSRQLVIEVRPTNKNSVPHLERGAFYKPEDVKAKTINRPDTFLSVEPHKKGLVGFFVNQVPRPGKRDPETKRPLDKKDLAAGKSRYRMRVEERRTYGQTMKKLARKDKGPGRFEVIGYVVHGYDENLVRKPIAGDHDMYDIRRPDGSHLPTAEYEALVEDMKAREFGVQHGAVVYWKPDKPKEREMRDKLVAQHKRDGDEGLVRFAPGQPPRYVVAETPL
jgi:hypothetical protein